MSQKNLTPGAMIKGTSKNFGYFSKAPRRPLNSYRLPPGPNPYSNEADFIINEKQIYKKMVNKYIPKYGSILTIYKEDTPCIIINDIDLAYDIFVNKYSKQVSGRQASYGEKILSGNLNNILNSDYSPVWKILQRCLHRGIKYCANFDRLNEIMHQSFALFKESVDCRGREINNGIKVEEDLFWMSDNVMTLLLFNEIFSDKEYIKLQKAMEEIPTRVEECEFDSPQDRSDYSAVKRLQESVDKLFAIVQKRIDEHRRRGDYKIATYDITDFILLGVEECHLDHVARKLDVELTELHAKHTLIDAMFASQEGLGNSFTWIVGLLALHSNIQESIRQELRQFQDDLTTPVSLFWKSKMPYTNAAMCEFQRVASADTFTDFHKALDDIKVGDYEIPRDSLVLLNIYAIHSNPKHWSEPHLVRPERFLSDDGSKFRRRKDFVPYGLGLRTCTGNVLSENILFLFMLLLVDSYQLLWGKSNKRNNIQDDSNAVFIRDVLPFYIQFNKLK